MGFREDPGEWKYRAGWSYGGDVSGTTDPSSYLWRPAGQGWARPFAQVFLRPQLTLVDLDFGTVPASGAAASTVAAMPDSSALKTTWGVCGLMNGKADELNTEVAAFGEAAGAVFVGGNFRYVQQSEAGAAQTEQPYLAAFDVKTGEWLSGFRPVLNGQVKAIAALPDGRVAIGGQFTQVNGVAQGGIAILDPKTGALSGTQFEAEHRSVGKVPYVHDLDVQGGYLYVAGSFTHLRVVGSTTSARAWNGGRFVLSTGLPDMTWNANFSGTSVAVDASAQGDRAYFSGYFRMKDTTPTYMGAAVQSAPGAALTSPAWTPTFSIHEVDATGAPSGSIWQNAVDEVGGRVWLGGSQHSLFSYDRNSFDLMSGNITKDGGDFQTIAHNADSSILVAGCHCGSWVYEDTYDFASPQTAATQADKINLIGAWNAKTGRFLYEWSPILQTRAGLGAWASFYDSTGVLWAGGDVTRSVRAGSVTQWSGGFVRFAPRDTSAPRAPGRISGTPSNGGTTQTLTWPAVTDSGTVTYEIIRGDRVVATTTTPSYTVPQPAEASSYFVRARDAAGNRSASTPAFVVQPPSADALTFIADGATWSWRYSSDALPAAWTTTAFDDSAWSTGAAVLGRGVTTAATDIDPSKLTTKPLSAQFRHAFQVDDAKDVSGGRISVIADDGVVLYLNGVELTRVQMPAGTITPNTYATASPTSAAAAASRAVFDVPDGLLVDGKNVIAASVHANYRTTKDLSFDLAFTAERVAVPGAVTGLAGTGTADTVTLTWAAPSGAAATSYQITRDGQKAGTVTAPTTTFSDPGRTAETAYTYTVVAVGADGVPSAPASVRVTTAAAAPVDTSPVEVRNGENWSWRYSADALPAGWNARDFDDSAWQTGPAVLARGVAGAVTDIGSGAGTNPLSAQFRHAFTVTDPTGVKDGTVTVIADDGVVVYLNGTELGRDNLPAGTITQNTYAVVPRWASTSAAKRVTFTVPARLLVAGTNVISASVHGNYHATPDLSFDLALSMPRG